MKAVHVCSLALQNIVYLVWRLLWFFASLDGEGPLCVKQTFFIFMKRQSNETNERTTPPFLLTQKNQSLVVNPPLAFLPLWASFAWLDAHSTWKAWLLYIASGKTIKSDQRCCSSHLCKNAKFNKVHTVHCNLFVAPEILHVQYQVHQT